MPDRRIALWWICPILLFGPFERPTEADRWVSLMVEHHYLGFRQLVGEYETLIRYVTDRPGHDRRYSIDASKIQLELGWFPAYSFEEALAKTIDWYLLAHGEQWWAAPSGASA